MLFKPFQHPDRESIKDFPGSLQQWLRLIPDLIPKVETYDENLTPSSISAGDMVEESFTVNGLETQDIVSINPPSYVDNIFIGACRVSSANTLSIQFYNISGGALSPPSGNYLIKAIRR